MYIYATVYLLFMYRGFYTTIKMLVIYKNLFISIYNHAV